MSDHRTPQLRKAESLSAYQRWEMASFDPVPVERTAPPIDGRARSRICARVRDEAHAQGLASGHVAGQALGYQAGYDQGHAQGFEARPPRSARGSRAARRARRYVQDRAASRRRGRRRGAASRSRSISRNKWCRQHLQLDPTALLAVAREVMATEPALSGAPYLIVNPADLPMVEAYLLEELQARGWSVRTDPGDRARRLPRACGKR